MPNYRKAIDAIDHVNMFPDDDTNPDADDLTDFDLGKKWNDAREALNNLVEANIMHAIDLLVKGLCENDKYEIDSYHFDKHEILFYILPSLSPVMKKLRTIDKELNKQGISSNIAPIGFSLTVYASLCDRSHDQPMFSLIVDSIDHLTICFDKSFKTQSADKLKILEKAINIVKPFLKNSKD